MEDMELARLGQQVERLFIKKKATEAEMVNILLAVINARGLKCQVSRIDMKELYNSAFRAYKKAYEKEFGNKKPGA